MDANSNATNTANHAQIMPANFSSAMTVHDFCQRYSISRSMAYNENKAGRLTFRKLGTRTLIMEGDAQRWAQSLPEAKTA